MGRHTSQDGSIRASPAPQCCYGTPGFEVWWRLSQVTADCGWKQGKEGNLPYSSHLGALTRVANQLIKANRCDTTRTVLAREGYVTVAGLASSHFVMPDPLNTRREYGYGELSSPIHSGLQMYDTEAECLIVWTKSLIEIAIVGSNLSTRVSKEMAVPWLLAFVCFFTRSLYRSSPLNRKRASRRDSPNTCLGKRSSPKIMVLNCAACCNESLHKSLHGSIPSCKRGPQLTEAITGL